MAEVTQLAERLEKWSCVIKAKVGEEGKLFGSVTRQDIASRLQSEGFNVDKRQIDLFEPIHRVGKYQVRVRLHAEVERTLQVTVVQE